MSSNNPVLPDGITLPNQSSPPVGEGSVFTKEWYLALMGMAGKLNKIPAGSDHWVQVNDQGLLGAFVGFEYDPALGATIAGSSILGVSYSLNLYDENASPGIAMFLGDANNLPGSGQLTAIWASDLFTAFGVANASGTPVTEQLQNGNMKVAGASTIGTIYPLNLYDSNSSPGIVLSDGDLSASTIFAIWACDVNVAFGVVNESGDVISELMQTGIQKIAGTSSGTNYVLQLFDSSNAPGVNLYTGTLGAPTKAGSWVAGATAAFGVQNASDALVFEILQAGDLLLTEIAAPALSGAGEFTMYADSTTHTPMWSQNGSAYAAFSGGSTPGAWTTYTPTTSNLTSTSSDSAHQENGKRAMIRIAIQGTSNGSNPTFSIPFSIASVNITFAVTITTGGTTIVGWAKVSGTTITVGTYNNSALSAATVYTFVITGVCEKA